MNIDMLFHYQFFGTLGIGAYSVYIHNSAVLYFMHRTRHVQCVNISLYIHISWTLCTHIKIHHLLSAAVVPPTGVEYDCGWSSS